jgi:hypothetical protein
MAGQTVEGNSKSRRFREGTPLLAGGGVPIVGIGETSLQSCRGRECTDYVRDEADEAAGSITRLRFV